MKKFVVLVLALAATVTAQQKKGGVNANVSVTPFTAPIVNLSWIPSNGCVTGTGAVNCTPVTSFIIRRGTASGAESNFATVPIANLVACPTGTPPNNTQCWNDTSAFTPGATYYYQVESVNQAGSSGPSNEANVTIPPTLVVPNAPSGLTTSQQ